MRTSGTLVLIIALGCAACAPAPTTDGETEPAVESPTDPENPALLRRPFTAEQIRDAWVAGLQLDIQIVTPEGPALQRWTVLEADDEAALVEYANVDGAGQLVDQQAVRSGWIELRDHASFPSALAERRLVTRTTPLGELEGWLYTVQDPAEETVSEYFFARSLPGAPVHTITRRGEETLYEMTQLAQRRPE